MGSLTTANARNSTAFAPFPRPPVRPHDPCKGDAIMTGPYEVLVVSVSIRRTVYYLRHSRAAVYVQQYTEYLPACNVYNV